MKFLHNLQYSKFGHFVNTILFNKEYNFAEVKEKKEKKKREESGPTDTLIWDLSIDSSLLVDRSDTSLL
jgi:hypothetical protein